MSTRLRIIGIAGLCLVASGLAQGQCGHTPGNPDGTLEGTGYGSSVAMSADGNVALAGGPGYDLGDGIVRTFERVEGEWTEGSALGAHVFLGDSFGWCLAISDDGNTAVISAPYEWSFDPQIVQWCGAAYIYERDPVAGTWSESERFASPDLGVYYNFGASCAISPDGNIVVIGETNILGTEFQDLPDAAYVYTRTGDVWSGPQELVPAPAVDPWLNYGHSVAISDDGTLIAVGAPTAVSEPISGEVHIFELQGGVWTHIKRIERLIPNAAFNAFGTPLAFHGQTLVTQDGAEDEEGPAPGLDGPPLLFYEPQGGVYPDLPTDTLFFPAGFGGGASALVIRGDDMMVGSFGVLHFRWVEVDEGVFEWRSLGYYNADDYNPDEGSSSFGHAVAFGDSPADMVVGEPEWRDDLGNFNVGRIHFPDRVFEDSSFQIAPTESHLTLDLLFPGMDVQREFVFLLGFFQFEFPESCDGEGLPIQAILEDFEIRTVEKSVQFDGPMGIPITLTDAVISLASPSAPALLSPSGQVFFDDMVVHIEVMVQIGKLKPFKFTAEGPQEGAMPARFVQRQDEPFAFSIDNLVLDFAPDIGLGKNNPSVHAFGPLDLVEEPPCEADIIADGLLDFFDLQAFLNAFASMIEPGDWNDDDAYDFFDLQGFLNAFAEGCP